MQKCPTLTYTIEPKLTVRRSENTCLLTLKVLSVLEPLEDRPQDLTHSLNELQCVGTHVLVDLVITKKTVILNHKKDGGIDPIILDPGVSMW